ncbi:hypothetical protein [Marinimicrobium sp. C2-29]|uniref:hypothetical protein n=1 Tax=Marinimicrobium sp. C2-29 TaxID=3139825 RepID=UPI003139655F
MLSTCSLDERDAVLAARLFELHGVFAITLGVVALGHIAAAVRHMLRKDGIVRRML